MSDRKAMEQAVLFILKILKDEGEFTLSDNTLEYVAQLMQDDYMFLERLKDFVYEHLEDFGENYGVCL